jgi:rSAM/selenodomain-associated transferase 2
MNGTGRPISRICVIVPALNEGAGLDRFLSKLAAAKFSEIVVVDNGSTDDTASIALRHDGVRLVRVAGGRGPALNAGARATTAEFILFLHADTELPDTAATMIEAVLANPDAAGGCFRLGFDKQSRTLRLYAWFTRFDTAFTTFGDQAYFVRRQTFERVGGFPEWPLMEDVELRRRLKGVGRFVKLPLPVVTSARRFEKRGEVHQQLKNAALLIAFYLGISPRRIADWYRSGAT